MTWDQASPFALGRVLAYYEHVTAVSGWLCGLNSFDQPGVELGKKLARAYIDWIEDTTTAPKCRRQPPHSATFPATLTISITAKNSFKFHNVQAMIGNWSTHSWRIDTWSARKYSSPALSPVLVIR